MKKKTIPTEEEQVEMPLQELRQALRERMGIAHWNDADHRHAYLKRILEAQGDLPRSMVNLEKIRTAMTEIAAWAIHVNVAITHLSVKLLSNQQPKKYERNDKKSIPPRRRK